MSTVLQTVASKWTPAEAQTLRMFERAMATQRQSRWPHLVAAFAGSILLLYLLPLALEFEMLRRSNAMLACVLFGDVSGCAVLYMLGRKHLALALYATCTLVESLLLLDAKISASELLLLTNLLPALVCAAVVALAIRAGRSVAYWHSGPCTASPNEASSVSASRPLSA